MGFRLSSEPVILLYTVIFTINYTVLPQLVLQKICLQQNQYNETACENNPNPSDKLQQESTKWWFYLLACSLVPAVFTVLIWGPITDIIGRKRAMLFVPVINAIRALVYLTNSYYMHANVAYMLFGSFLSCLYGEFQGVVALCYAYIADITSGSLDNRTMRMALIEASLFFAGVPAGLLSGYLLQQIGFISVFILTLGINVLIFFYVLCFLPDKAVSIGSSKTSSTTRLLADSLHEAIPDVVPGSENEKMEDEEKEEEVAMSSLLNPFLHLKQVVAVVTDPRCRHVVIPLICAFGFTVCSFIGEMIVSTLYLKNKPFLFSPQMVGYYMAVQAGIRGIGVFLITQMSHRCFNFSDYSLIIFGLISQVSCYLLIGLARSASMVFIVNIAGVAAATATSAIRSLITKQVLPHQYGAVLASIEATDAFASVVANAASLWTYNLTLTVYSGVVFFALSGFSFVSLILIIVVYCRMKYFYF